MNSLDVMAWLEMMQTPLYSKVKYILHVGTWTNIWLQGHFYNFFPLNSYLFFQPLPAIECLALSSSFSSFITSEVNPNPNWIRFIFILKLFSSLFISTLSVCSHFNSENISCSYMVFLNHPNNPLEDFFFYDNMDSILSVCRLISIWSALFYRFIPRF